MNKQRHRPARTWILALVLFAACTAAGCKTGKGCDCPTFGKNETPKVNRF